MSASNNKMAAAALLAVSAGACVGVALSFSGVATTSLYAPTAVQTAAATRVSAVNVPRTQMGAYAADYAAAPQAAAYQQYEQAAPMYQAAAAQPLVGAWTMVQAGVLAMAAAVVGFVYNARSSKAAAAEEQLAMLAVFGKKAAAPKATTKKASKAASGEQQLWYPSAVAPEWLDGSLPGDRGFDPLGLSKPTEYLQFDLDALDQNAPKNRAGDVLGRRIEVPDEVSTDRLQPYSEVFGIQRFRECELIHGRWSMLATLGILIAEPVSGVAWQQAGAYELSGAKYFGFDLPFTTTQVVIFEVLAMGAIEIYRNTELDPEKRCYPGGPFDPFGLTSKDDATTFRLKEAELKHSRLAMLAFLGFSSQALATGLGATGSFSNWAAQTWG